MTLKDRKGMIRITTLVAAALVAIGVSAPVLAQDAQKPVNLGTEEI